MQYHRVTASIGTALEFKDKTSPRKILNIRTRKKTFNRDGGDKGDKR
jgi:hypothetical protein